MKRRSDEGVFGLSRSRFRLAVLGAWLSRKKGCGQADLVGVGSYNRTYEQRSADRPGVVRAARDPRAVGGAGRQAAGGVVVGVAAAVLSAGAGVGGHGRDRLPRSDADRARRSALDAGSG